MEHQLHLVPLTHLNLAPIAIAANHYRALGWWPIPLQAKKPITNWMTDPLLTPKQLDLLFPPTEPFAPHLNLGVRMGACSNIIGIDIDGEAGRNFITERMTPADIDRLRQTIQFSTPNGHRLIYRYPDIPQPSRSLRDPTNPQRELIRILSDGTQTVAPPSDIDGIPYLWSNHGPIATYPADLIAKLDNIDLRVLHHAPRIEMSVANTDANRRAAAWLAKCDPAVCGQGAHDHTFKLAIRLTRGFNLTYHVALQMLTDIWNPTCRRPWNDIELAHKVESALASTSPTRNML